MAGVVRRDGLREAVAKVERWVVPNGYAGGPAGDKTTAVMVRLDELSRVLDAVPDVPPTEAREPVASTNAEGWSYLPEPDPQHVSPEFLERLRTTRSREDPDFVMPDVPPDPPAADRDELARVLHDDSCSCNSNSATSEPFCHPWGAGYYERKADALLSSGVLVDAADVRARALEDAADALDELANGLRTRETSATTMFYAGGLNDAALKLRDRAVSEREGTT